MSTVATAIPAASAESQARVVALLSKVTTIATLPEVTSKIISTVEDTRSTAADLRRIVSHDPALVTRVLKSVNSSFYGLPGQVSSVERAIVLLGLNAVKNLAIAASLGQLFRGARLCEKFTVKDLWTHCVGVGVTARALARQMKLPLADEAFLGGMIHDVGLLVLLQSTPEQLREVCESASKTGGDFCQIEQRHIGVDHQQVGMALAAQWKFPQPCQLVAGYHHQPLALPEEHRLLVALVWAADTICCRNGVGFTLTAGEQTLDPPLLADLHLDPDAIAATEAQLPELLKSASQLMA
jgi:HD-like signal output (HDOD) protein